MEKLSERIEYDKGMRKAEKTLKFCHAGDAIQVAC